MPPLPWLEPGDPFPPVERALRRPNGLLAAGGDLSVPMLVGAYRRGIFPWTGDGEPLLWWSPDPRMVLALDEFRVSRSLRRRIRSGVFTVTLDTAFGAVVEACAEARRDAEGTWITRDIHDAYVRLHGAGFAHSVESWADGRLAGGLYGVVIGRMFFGESMFARASDASKVALAHLVGQLAEWGFELVDCQMSTPHLATLGAREMPRHEFLRHVSRLTSQPGPPVPWRFDADPAGASG
ncbi:MAG: leucyl/phenylalanyl-tRNA--protein transferase [Acidimicrobiia bacterium]|nr:leucyl/phenylalanyl-tRNA--protein transferase [Acidimicrobiia bacterium]